MSGHDHPLRPGESLRPVAEHARVVAALVSARPPERVRLADALGRACVHDVTAPIALPGFDNSAMDGYAVRATDVAAATDDEPVVLPVAADIPAGRTDELTLEPGTAHRIMTGAPMPDGADAVVQVEYTDGGTTTVAIRRAVDAGTSVRRAGSDIAAGDLALAAGTVLHAPQIGLLSALGVAEVDVPPRLHVVVLSTGSELVAAGQPLLHGQIHESNGAMLCAAVTAAGARASAMHFVPDDVDEFRAHLDGVVDSDDPPDLVLTSGGVSAGAYEVVKDALARDEVEFVKVAMQPGMPQGCGRYSSSSGRSVPIVTLPGNPVSAQVSFEIFVRPPLRDAMGLSRDRRRATAVLTDDLRSPPGKRQFRRGVVEPADGGGLQVHPIGPPSSHHLRYLASANALVDIPAEASDVARGTAVEVLLLDD
ncbi:molybdopterin molybdotransferase MoeA [Williamsia deligens]|uniref:Molybdopterin molybdenumtransferase n=1 Tax=Williamsia deligens TaxID=321325 RepID=A0ABW3G5Y8_9NOCA|nr:gephyrin-like molybdotransferase Glp [Williamsia deligens]MCP2193160.1 molybdopterin molybdotransferase [Williamsia deligens]